MDGSKKRFSKKKGRREIIEMIRKRSKKI